MTDLIEYKAAPIQTQQIQDRTVTGIASVFGNVDDNNDIIHPGAFAKTIQERGKRARHLWQHDGDQPPTAKIDELREISRDQMPADLLKENPEVKGGLLVKRTYLDTPRGSEVLAGIMAEAINEMSVGITPVKKDFSTEGGKNTRNIREVRLYDTSDVQWGMNPITRTRKSLQFDMLYAICTGQDLATLLAAGQSLSSEQLDQIVQAFSTLSALLAGLDQGTNPYDLVQAAKVQKALDTLQDAGVYNKGVLPYKATAKADKGMAWDGPAQVSKADIADLKTICAWVDSSKPEDKGSYKLPHHEADGDHAVVWSGVKAAMGALLGARGGTKLPEADRKAVYNHLAKHYKQFDETPPDYKFVQIAYTAHDARNLVGAGVDLKAGRAISAANQAKIKDALDSLEKTVETLEDLLGLAEPQSEEQTEDKALTAKKALLMRLAIAEREASN